MPVLTALVVLVSIRVFPLEQKLVQDEDVVEVLLEIQCYTKLKKMQLIALVLQLLLQIELLIKKQGKERNVLWFIP